MTETLELLFMILGVMFICFIVRLFMLEFLSTDINHNLEDWSDYD